MTNENTQETEGKAPVDLPRLVRILESLAETFDHKSNGAYQAGWRATVSRDRLWARSECFRECAHDVRTEIAKLSEIDTALADKPNDESSGFAAMTGSAACDWPEDASHENGNYQNRCCHCERMFIGHKRRVTCRVCADEWKAKWDAMTEAERVAHTEKQRAEVAAWMARRVSAEPVRWSEWLAPDHSNSHNAPLVESGRRGAGGLTP